MWDLRAIEQRKGGEMNEIREKSDLIMSKTSEGKRRMVKEVK